jgi:tetratricopeptide (TPR) repeat protein
MEKLAKANPANISIQEYLAEGHYNFSGLLLPTGRLDEAMAANLKALAVIQTVAKAHPAVTKFQLDLSYCHWLTGDQLSLMGKLEQAMEAHRKVLAINQKLADANPTVPEFQYLLAAAHNNIGRLLARQKRFAEAFTAIDAGMAIRRKLVDADPKTVLYTTGLASSHAFRGWALSRSGEPSKAASDLRQALELWAKDPAPGHPDTRFERSRTLALLAGLGGVANSGVTKDEAAAFADQAVAALRDAFSAGWGWTHELKEPDFDAIRGRDDFRKLVAEVEAKAGSKARPKD